MTPSPQSVTQMLLAWGNGDKEALDHLMPVVYDELRRQAARYLRRERPGHTLQTTALIHEAYIRLIDQKHVRWQNRAQFFGIAAQLAAIKLYYYRDWPSAERYFRRGIELDPNSAEIRAHYFLSQEQVTIRCGVKSKHSSSRVMSQTAFLNSRPSRMPQRCW